MAVGALEPAFYAELLRRLDLGPGDGAGPDRPGPVAGVATTARRTGSPSGRQAEWSEVFDGSDACVAPVLSAAAAARHPHLVARGTYVEHAGQVQPAPAPRFGGTPAELGRPPARPGQHTRAALVDWGVTDVDGLLAAGRRDPGGGARMSAEAYVYQAIRTPRGRGKAERRAARRDAGRPRRRAAARAAAASARARPGGGRRRGAGHRHADQRPGRRPGPHGGADGGLARHGGRGPAQPVLCERAGGRQPGGGAGPLRLGEPARRRRRRVDVAGADGQ